MVDTEILACAIIIAASVFVVFLILALIHTAKTRKKVRQKLEKIQNFLYQVDSGKEVYYSCYESKDCLRDQHDNLVKILDGIVDCEIIYPVISTSSPVPEKGYRIGIVDGDFRRDRYRLTGDLMEIFVRPARDKIPDWTVVLCDDKIITLEHPVLGKLNLKNVYKACFERGHKLTLMQGPFKISDRVYSLDYIIV